MKALYRHKLRIVVIILVFATSALLFVHIYNSSRYTTYNDTTARFAVTYPSRWGNKQQAVQNELQQGAVLYKPDGMTEIGIYKSSKPWSLSVQDSNVERSNIPLDNGLNASTLLVNSDKTIRYTAVIQSDSQYYVVYVHSSRAFYQENKEHVTQMVKSFRIY